MDCIVFVTKAAPSGHSAVTFWFLKSQATYSKLKLIFGQTVLSMAS